MMIVIAYAAVDVRQMKTFRFFNRAYKDVVGGVVPILDVFHPGTLLGCRRAQWARHIRKECASRHRHCGHLQETIDVFKASLNKPFVRPGVYRTTAWASTRSHRADICHWRAP